MASTAALFQQYVAPTYGRFPLAISRGEGSWIWDEEGKRSALTQVGGSLVVSVLAYLFMRVPQIQYWAFYFPEMLLLLLAFILLIGRYTGYRISELIRFKSFTNA